MERLVAFLHDLFGPSGMRMMYPAALSALRADDSHGGEASDLLTILAGYVAGDTDFKGREDWQREALDLAKNLIGPNAPVVEKIQEAFAGQDQARLNRFVEQVQHVSTLIEDGRFEEAIAASKHTLEHIRPHDSLKLRFIAVWALTMKGFAFFKLKQHEDATTTWERISAYIRPDDSEEGRKVTAQVHNLNGMALTELGRHEEAIATRQRVTEYVRPDDSVDSRQLAAEALLAKGDVLAKLERHEEAIVTWERVTEYVRSDDPTELRYIAINSLHRKVITLVELERYEEAPVILRRSSEYVRPDDPMEIRHQTANGLILGSLVANLLGRHDEVEADCRRAIDIEPTYDEAWRALAETILCQDDDARLSEAEQCARRAVELASKNPNALRTLSDVLARCGKWTEALDQLENALSIGGDDFQEQNRPV